MPAALASPGHSLDTRLYHSHAQGFKLALNARATSTKLVYLVLLVEAGLSSARFFFWMRMTAPVDHEPPKGLRLGLG